MEVSLGLTLLVFKGWISWSSSSSGSHGCVDDCSFCWSCSNMLLFGLWACMLSLMYARWRAALALLSLYLFRLSADRRLSFAII